jgi:hypothetical protein
MRKPHPYNRTEDDLRPVVRHIDAILDRVPHRILHPLFTMIQNAESVVPSATIAAEKR